MWRPETGFIYFGEKNESYFAWLVAQPSSNVKAKLVVNEIEKNLQGVGYHDHNWGNSPMHKNLDNWYWGRAILGEYTLIFSDIVAHKDYDYTHIPLMMIAKNGEILNLKNDIKVQRNQLQIDEKTGKSYANQLIFTQSDENNKTYTIEVNKKRDISFLNMAFLPYETGDNPTYLRTLSDIKLTIQEDNKTYTINGEAIVEQMSFYKELKN